MGLKEQPIAGVDQGVNSLSSSWQKSFPTVGWVKLFKRI